MISISLISYGKSINFNQLQDRNGAFYEVNQQIPYTGEVINYYENGKIETKANFKDGKKEGELIGYYENGQIKGKRNYKNGKLIN